MNKQEIMDISQTIAGTQGRLDYAEHLYALASCLPDNPTILEIGTQEGGSTVVIGLTVNKTKFKMYCIDPCFVKESERPEGYKQYELIGKYTLPNVQKLLEKHNLQDNITLVPGSSEEVLNVWDEKYSDKFDMIYIDGDHTYKALKIDLLWEKYAKDKCIIVLDDWITGVKIATQEYLNDNKPEWKVRKDHTFWPMYYTRNYGDKDIHK